MGNQFDYINNYYKLSVKRGTRLKFQGRLCVVVSSTGVHLTVKPLDDEKKRLLIHPTWEVEYLKGARVGKKRSATRLPNGRYLYRGYVITCLGYSEPCSYLHRHMRWEAVNPATGCAEYHAETKRELMNEIDDDLEGGEG